MPTVRAAEIGEEEPVRLADAVRLFFPAGGMTLSALRTEARKGRLEVMRVAGKDWTTHRAIREMLDRCRVAKARPVSPSAPKLTDEGSGSSETGSAISAQAALRIKLSKPPKDLRTTSGAASGRTRQNVVRLPSSSPPS